jgi:hypothetical protein
MQLNVDPSSNLVMHMLVLYGNTGSKMDLSCNGNTVAVMRKMLPECKYTPCIEEHNIHAIFRWTSVWPILQSSARLDRVLQPDPIHANCGVDAVADTVSTPAYDQATSHFLKATGLTLSITTLGTCIYRFGKKRNRDPCHAELLKQHGMPDAHSEYSAETEACIFQLCQYMHHLITTS